MQIGSNNDDVVTKMLLDTSGGIIIAGETLGDLDSYTNAGGRDIFVIKLNPSGSVQWTMQRGSSGDEYASSLQLDSADTIYLAGDTSGDLDGNSNTGGRDAYVIKLTSLGAWTSTLQIGSGQDDRYIHLKVDSGGSVIMAGSTKSRFPPISSSGGQWDAFVSMLEQHPVTTATTTSSTATPPTRPHRHRRHHLLPRPAAVAQAHRHPAH